MSDLYLFRNSLRDLLRVRRLVAAGLLIAGPSLIAVLWRSLSRRPDPDMIYDTLSGLLVFGFLLVILAVVFATGVVTQEIEQKTITYLLTRPVPRWRILMAKFAAALVTIAATAWLACICLGVAAYGFGGASQRAGGIGPDDLTNVHALVQRLNDDGDVLSVDLAAKLPADLGMQLKPIDPITQNPKPADDETIRKPLAEGLSGLVQSGEPLYDEQAFAGVHLSADTLALVKSHPKGRALSRLNRELLVEAFPGDIAPPISIATQLRRDVLVLTVGAVAYGSAFLLLATFLSRPLLWGLLFAFGWETWVPNWPGNFQRISLMSYLRVLAPHPQPDTGDQGLSGLFGAINPETITRGASWAVLGGCAAFCLAMAVLIFSVREYVPRDAD